MINNAKNLNTVKKHRRTKSSYGNDIEFMIKINKKKSENNLKICNNFIKKSDLINDEIGISITKNAIQKINKKQKNKKIIIDSLNDCKEFKPFTPQNNCSSSLNFNMSITPNNRNYNSNINSNLKSQFKFISNRWRKWIFWKR